MRLGAHIILGPSQMLEQVKTHIHRAEALIREQHTRDACAEILAAIMTLNKLNELLGRSEIVVTISEDAV